MLCVFCVDNSYAYNSIFQAKNLEYLDGVAFNSEYPALVYRTFTSAAESTRNRYYCQNVSSSKCLDLASDGWAYVQGSNATSTNKNYLVVQKDANGNIIMPGGGTSRTTFRGWSSYFHPYQNTSYVRFWLTKI